MSDQVGYIKLHRRCLDNPLLKKADAQGVWDKLLMKARRGPYRDRVNGQDVDLERGEVVISVQPWAVELGMTRKRLRGILGTFLAQGMIATVHLKGHAATKITICNYAFYQDVDETEGHPRGQRRANLGPTSGQLQEREGEKERRDSSLRSESPAVPSRRDDDALMAEAVAIWNRVAGDVLPRCRELTAARKAPLRKRLIDDCKRDLAAWEAYCSRLRASRFCCGGGRTGWKATIDFALKPNSYVLTLEGKYDDRPAAPRRDEPRHPPNGGGDWWMNAVRDELARDGGAEDDQQYSDDLIEGTCDPMPDKAADDGSDTLAFGGIGAGHPFDLHGRVDALASTGRAVGMRELVTHQNGLAGTGGFASVHPRDRDAPPTLRVIAGRGR